MNTHTNNLEAIFTAMKGGYLAAFRDTSGKPHIGIINSIMREDGSGKNWIVSVNHNLKTKKIFIHAK
jgi:uncharacterized protein YijF (DUF1287 family)